MKKSKGFKIIAIPVFVIAVLSGFSVVVMYLWNFAVVSAIGLNEITFYEAMGLLVLSKILFGFGMGGRHKGWKSKSWGHYKGHFSEEQKEKFREKWGTIKEEQSKEEVK